MNEALLPVVNGLEFLSPPLPQEKQETLVRRVLEQGAVENLPGAQKASTAVPAIVPDAAAPPEKMCIRDSDGAVPFEKRHLPVRGHSGACHHDSAVHHLGERNGAERRAARV